jgi:hypothetical protein
MLGKKLVKQNRAHPLHHTCIGKRGTQESGQRGRLLCLPEKNFFNAHDSSGHSICQPQELKRRGQALEMW